MLKNLFFHENNRNIYKGAKESASPIREAYTLPTEMESKKIDRQEYQCKQLEKAAKKDLFIACYM